MTIRLKGLARLGATALLLCTTLAWSAERSPTAPAIEWRQRWDEAMELARNQGKPVLMDFWATWCQPCREMEVQLWSRTDVVALASKFVCLRVDVDRHPEIAQRYRADALPTVVLSDPWGTEIARREGFSRADDYLGILRAMPGDFSEIGPWQARLAANRRDPQALREIGLAYHRMKLFQASTVFLEKALARSEVRSQPEVLAEVLTVIGWNSLKIGSFKSAKRTFERCLKDVPTHRALDVTVYGLFAAHLAAGERQEAEPLLHRLESCCPDSPLTLRAHVDLKPLVAQDK